MIQVCEGRNGGTLLTTLFLTFGPPEDPVHPIFREFEGLASSSTSHFRSIVQTALLCSNGHTGDV